MKRVKIIIKITIYSMTYYALLKPFKWNYPIFMSLPQGFDSILGSPVPILIGILLMKLYVSLNSFRHQPNL